MSIEIESAGPAERERWDTAVEQSPETIPLHRFEALQRLAETANANLHPLMGFKGQEPVGILPLFEYSRGPLSIVRSPPQGLGIHHLGPVQLNHRKLTQRKAEKRNQRFVDACLESLDAVINPDHVEIRTTTGYADTRPFIWNDFDVEIDYTYVVDLTPGVDALFEQVSSEVRRKVRSDDADRFTVERGDAADAGRITLLLQRRYNDRPEPYLGITPRLAVDLFEALPDNRIQVYVCRIDGEIVGGGIILETDDTAYRWQGFPRVESDIPVNDLLDWHIIRDAIDRGKSHYDLVGAMNTRLSEYKSKFAPEVIPTFVMHRETDRMRLASEVQRLLGGLDAFSK